MSNHVPSIVSNVPESSHAAACWCGCTSSKPALVSEAANGNVQIPHSTIRAVWTGRAVELQYTHLASPPCTKAVLAHYSGVLRGLLETDSTVPGISAAQSPESSDTITIPLDDADCTAFEEALSFMYPASPLPCMTWDNVERLLLLSDKYDMPVLRGEKPN